jgi:type VI secretion system secreted protein Hcp
MGFRAVVIIDGVSGKSDLASNGIDVLSYSWGIDNNIKAWQAKPAGTAHVHDFSFVKMVDDASPTLLTNCANGKKMSSVELQLFQASGDANPEKFASYKFSDCYLSNISPGGSSGSDYPLENVSVNFDKVEYSYNSANGGFDVGKGGITGQ